MNTGAESDDQEIFKDPARWAGLSNQAKVTFCLTKPHLLHMHAQCTHLGLCVAWNSRMASFIQQPKPTVTKRCRMSYSAPSTSSLKMLWSYGETCFMKKSTMLTDLTLNLMRQGGMWNKIVSLLVLSCTKHF